MRPDMMRPNVIRPNTVRPNTVRPNSCKAVCAALLLVMTLTVAGAQNFTLHYLELTDLFHTPALITLSPNYQTTLEFDGLAVEQVSTGRADQLTAEVSGSTIRLRANANVISTDLTVTVGGRTALFALQADPTAAAPNHYLIRDLPPVPPRSASPPSMRENQAREHKNRAEPDGTGQKNPADRGRSAQNTVASPDVDFQTSARRNGDEIVIQYVLKNIGDAPLYTNPRRLKLRYGRAELPYTLWRVPERENRLAPGASEYGTLIVPSPPPTADSIKLRWVLAHIGSATFGTLERNLTLPLETGRATLP